jgi:hypothetical protein
MRAHKKHDSVPVHQILLKPPRANPILTEARLHIEITLEEDVADARLVLVDEDAVSGVARFGRTASGLEHGEEARAVFDGGWKVQRL